MNAFLLSAVLLPAAGGLGGFLIWAAIIAVVVWALVALVKSTGIAIPQPVWIILSALAAIFLIVLMARLFGYAV